MDIVNIFFSYKSSIWDQVKKIRFPLKKSLTISQRKEYVLYSDADNGTTWNAKKERLFFFVTDTQKIQQTDFDWVLFVIPLFDKKEKKKSLKSIMMRNFTGYLGFVWSGGDGSPQDVYDSKKVEKKQREWQFEREGEMDKGE